MTDEGKISSLPKTAGPQVQDVAMKAANPTISGRLPYHRSITRGQLSSGGILHGIASEDGVNVAWVSGALLGSHERLDFIVRACNSHHDMLEALRKIEGGWVPGHLASADNEAFIVALQEIARAAIAKATQAELPTSDLEMKR